MLLGEVPAHRLVGVSGQPLQLSPGHDRQREVCGRQIAPAGEEPVACTGFGLSPPRPEENDGRWLQAVRVITGRDPIHLTAGGRYRSCRCGSHFHLLGHGGSWSLASMVAARMSVNAELRHSNHAPVARLQRYLELNPGGLLGSMAARSTSPLALTLFPSAARWCPAAAPSSGGGRPWAVSRPRKSSARAGSRPGPWRRAYV